MIHLQVFTNITNFFRQTLNNASKQGLIATGLILIILIGFLDWYTGGELVFSTFYLLPVALVSWYVDRRNGMILAFVSAFVKLTADLADNLTTSHILIPYWNALMRLCIFTIMAYLLSALQTAYDQARNQARTDYLTGAANSRYFNERTELEIYRAHRYQHPLSLAYLDVDNFKLVNDRFGHAAGDQLLQRISKTMLCRLRQSDLVARLGGDEFAILMPETDYSQAQNAVNKIKQALQAEMDTGNWPATFSFGLATFDSPPGNIDEMIKAADQLAYQAKAIGKNTITAHHFTKETNGMTNQGNKDQEG